MCLEGLNRPLGLISPVIAWGDEFVFHAVVSYFFFECFGGLVVQDVFLQAKACRSHYVDNSLVRRHHLTFCPVFHGLVENVICVEVNCHHDKPVSPLRREGKATGLISVDCFAQVLDVEKMSWWRVGVVVGESLCSCLIMIIAVLTSLTNAFCLVDLSPVVAP